MFARDIEAIFTDKVNDYIQKGYIFSPATMSGHQGEIGKVDLRKGDEIVRVLLTNERDHCADVEAIVLTIGRVERKQRRGYELDSMAQTIWNNKLEVIEKRVFYVISDRDEVYTEDLAEYEAVVKKQKARLCERYSKRTESKHFTSEAARKAVLPFVRRQNKCKGKKLSDILEVEHRMNNKDGSSAYYVVVNGGARFALA